MASTSSKYGLSIKYALIIGVVLGAALYQSCKGLLSVTLGIGRKNVQTIQEFPSYQCRRIHDPRIQACEDMWLSEETRQLFLACSDPRGRQQWMPNFHRTNASGRSLDDAVIAMDIDKPKGDGFEYRVLETPSFTSGDGHLYLVGMTGEETGSTIRLALVNARPHFDSATGGLLDNDVLGGDYVVELFETTANAKELRHVQTYEHDGIKTLNNVAFAPSASGFYLTNDHGNAKSGLKSFLAPFLGKGDVTFCSTADLSKPSCKIVSNGHQFPNGLLMTRSNHLAVPSAHSGGIRVYQPSPDGSLTEIGSIYLPMPIDNLSEDANGDIWLAAFPKGLQILQMYNDPWNVVSASSIFRLSTEGEEMVVEKVLEDAKGEILPGATTVVHDVKTGRLFVSGVISPFITVCDKV